MVGNIERRATNTDLKIKSERRKWHIFKTDLEAMEGNSVRSGFFGLSGLSGLIWFLILTSK